MAMKVEKISKEIIKPSTPTPDHLRSFNLSLLDQLSIPIFVPFILFYLSPSTTSSSSSSSINDYQVGVSDRLKKSLSEALTRFYPLAGRIKDNLLVDCNDEGIEYFETRVNGNISDFMKQDQLHYLIPPYDLHSTLKVVVDNDPLLIIQVNLFGCGGIAICVCMSHKIADAATLTTFINTWASITREATAESIVSPTFDSALLYPPREGVSSAFSSQIDKLITEQVQGQGAEKIVRRRLVFDNTKIATLQARYGSKNKKFPTRVETVIALIWKTVMTATSSPKPSVAKFPVDMRRRLDPPLPEQSFGNLTMQVTASAFITESTGEVDLVGPLRESICRINNGSLKVLQGDEGFLKFQDYFMKMKMEKSENDLEVYNFTSWCRFPLYEADFGWGKPNWVTIASVPFLKNICVLMDNRTGDGIEVMIFLVEEQMAKFERDLELLDFVSDENWVHGFLPPTNQFTPHHFSRM